MLSVREAGAGPLAILMHGISANAAVWDPVLEELAGQFHVIAIDQRGHGHSDHPESGYSGAAFADDVVSLISHLDEGPALVVGHSLGARNVLLLGAHNQNVVDAAVAIEFCAFIDPDIITRMEERVNGGNQRFPSYNDVIAYLVQRYPLLPGAAISRRARFGYRNLSDGTGMVPLAGSDALAEAGAALHENMEDAILRSETPTLIVRGSLSTFVGEDAFARTCKLRTDLESYVVRDADHYVPEERPIETSSAIKSFARNVGVL